MARHEQAIFTVLCMIKNSQGQVLLQNRTDPHWPGMCFPGGHVEHCESFTEAAVRETFEETGLTIQNPKLCGVKQFQTKDNARYVVFFYVADQFTGTLRASEEGEVFWVDRKDLACYPLVEDFMDMIKVMESPDLSEFYYYEKSGSWGLKLL